MEHAGRIVVVSAGPGAGPDRDAAELTRRLRGLGYAVDRLSLPELLPRVPWRCLLLTSRFRVSTAVLRLLLRPVRRRVRRSIPPDARAVVTTSPIADQLLGPLRQQGRLCVPVISSGADLVTRPTPGVDIHCTPRTDPAGRHRERCVDPTRLVAEAASRSATAGPDEPGRWRLLDAVGDAVAVVAALLQSTGRVP
ncbi:hypothetical protein AB0F68_20235 [Micromonospora sp. NPDC023966]|uniref:hypothetical protein n=1 Tax=Micromonospora sp. NPDC023966 TaxID=3154699 RepID=UPI0033E8B2FC